MVKSPLTKLIVGKQPALKEIALPYDEFSDEQSLLLNDYLASGARSSPRSLQGVLPKRSLLTKSSQEQHRSLGERQTRHLHGIGNA